MIDYESMRVSAHNRVDRAVSKYIDNPNEGNYREMEIILEDFQAIMLGSAEQQSWEANKVEA
jgi:hypothetical protein